MSELDKFNAALPEFKDKVEWAKRQDISQWATPFWREKHEELLQYFASNRFGFDFLNHPDIGGTMFANDPRYMGFEQDYLAGCFNHRRAFLLTLLAENECGNPRLICPEWFTSHNSIHQLYHIIYGVTQNDWDKELENGLGNTMEFGGGYGCMAKILSRFRNASPNYYIVDLPALSCLQWLYLKTTCPHVNINFSDTEPVNNHKQNIHVCPITTLDTTPIRDINVFVSTWAISESNPYTQDYVLSRNIDGAKVGILAYQPNSPGFEYADRFVSELAKRNDMALSSREIQFISPNKYCWFKRNTQS